MNSLTVNNNASTQMLVFSTDADPMRLLADFPPFVPGYKSLPDNIAGVNRSMVSSDRRGLLGYVLPYLNMESTDQCRVYLGPRPTLVAGPFEVGAYVNQLVPFHVPAPTLEQMYASPSPIPAEQPLFVSIQRISENEKNFPALSLLYKPFGPGEEDTRHDLPNNQGLPLPIPSETVIDKTVMEQGMYITVPRYELQAIGDRVYLAIGARELVMTVTEPGDLLFELTPDFLASLPSTDRVSISYEIVDIVENGSGWSSAVTLALKPTTVLLSAPLVDESDEKDNLDHDALGGAAATVVITGQFKPGDIVTLKVSMLTAAGDRVERILIETVKTTIRSLRIPLENAFIQNGIRGSMTLSYTKQSSGVTHNSKCTHVTISGQALTLPAPTIDEQIDEELPADTSPAHVQIAKYWPLREDAIISLYWQVTGTNGVEHLYIFRQIIKDIEQPIVFSIPSEYIDRFESSPLTVLYKIENPDQVAVQSESLQITIGAAAELPAPVLIQASADNRVQPLDTRQVATVRVTDPSMTANKTYTLTVRGRQGFGSPVIASQVGNIGGELLFNLPLTAIPANIGNFIKISCTRAESGKPDQPSGVSRYEVLGVANPDINYPRMAIREAAAGQVLNLNSFSGDANWTLAPYLFIAVGTRLRVALSGNDSNHVIMLFDGVITASHVRDGLSGTINREQLKLFKDGTQVSGLSIVNYSDTGGVDTFLPMLELTIITLVLTRPAILQLTDNQGAITGPVNNGGACDAQSPQLRGSASPDSKVHLFNGNYQVAVFTADRSGIWVGTVNLGNGRHTLTAKTPDGRQVSGAWTVTIRPDLYDATTFLAGLNGWSIGSAGVRGELVPHRGSGGFWNYTPGGVNYAGTILYKNFSLAVGARYRFTALVGNYSGSGGRYDPILNLRVSNHLETQRTTPGRNQEIFLIGEFTAMAGSATFEVLSHQGTADGNDFMITSLLVEQLTNPNSA